MLLSSWSVHELYGTCVTCPLSSFGAALARAILGAGGGRQQELALGRLTRRSRLQKLGWVAWLTVRRGLKPASRKAMWRAAAATAAASPAPLPTGSAVPALSWWPLCPAGACSAACSFAAWSLANFCSLRAVCSLQI